MAQTRSPQRRDAVLTWRKWGEMRGGGGINFFSLRMTLPIGKAEDSQTGAGLAVDLWVSRTEASFSVKRKVFCFFFLSVYVIQE